MASASVRLAYCPTFCNGGHGTKGDLTLTRATQEDAGSPQIRRTLRSDDDEAAIAATISRPGAAAHSFTKLGTDQSLIKDYEARLASSGVRP